VAFSIFDRLSVGVILVDSSAKVLFANAAAQALSEEGGPLRFNSNLGSLSSEHGRRLADMIRSALGGASVRSMSVPASGNARQLLVLAAPVRGVDIKRSDVRSLRAAVAMVFICDPVRPAQVPAAWMMDGYGLTLAEARVALAFASGTTIPVAAHRLKVSVNTVKTHLRRVYEKTGTSRQAELSRLVAMLDLARESVAAR
jgi:DNA-binding CsgD family transcriptional regulator